MVSFGRALAHCRLPCLAFVVVDVVFPPERWVAAAVVFVLLPPPAPLGELHHTLVSYLIPTHDDSTFI
jgi:hypothetical protein